MGEKPIQRAGAADLAHPVNRQPMTTARQIAEEMAMATAEKHFGIPKHLCAKSIEFLAGEIISTMPLTQLIELAMAVNAWNKAPAGTVEENAQRVGLIIDALEALKATEKAQWL